MPSGSTCRERVPSLLTMSAALLSAALVAGSRPAQTQTVGAPPVTRTPASPGVFRSRTDLVALQVTVVDVDGRAVRDLRMEDFAVFEEGARQTVTLFATASSPLDVMMLLDTSGSMIERLDVAREAAIELVRTLRPGDRASLILFNDGVHIAQPLTEDGGALEAAIRRTHAAGGTALHEALYIALRELVRLHPKDGQIRRQALVVLSDGDDTTSRSVALQDVLDEARRSAVTVFTIVPAPGAEVMPLALTKRLPGALFNMRTLARETGGRTFTPARSEDLSGTYREIADELGQQYWLAYTPAIAASGFRRVSVRIVTQPQLRARTRSGYYAATPHAGAAVVSASPDRQ